VQAIGIQVTEQSRETEEFQQAEPNWPYLTAGMPDWHQHTHITAKDETTGRMRFDRGPKFVGIHDGTRMQEERSWRAESYGSVLQQACEIDSSMF